MIARLALVSIAVVLLPSLALAADLSEMRDRPKHRAYSVHARPYPLSWRAAKLRYADRCWRGCLAETGREFQTCLRTYGLDHCVAWNASADRHCLRACRLAGGPWVDLK
jgi:hypothetical protein